MHKFFAAFALCIAALPLCAQTTAMPNAFLTGGDISLLTKVEELGGVFRDGGKARDLLDDPTPVADFIVKNLQKATRAAP